MSDGARWLPSSIGLDFRTRLDGGRIGFDPLIRPKILLAFRLTQLTTADWSMERYLVPGPQIDYGHKKFQIGRQKDNAMRRDFLSSVLRLLPGGKNCSKVMCSMIIPCAVYWILPNLGLKKITDDKGPVPIRFEWDDKKTLMPLGEHTSHWSNYLGELIGEMPLYYPSLQKILAERKAAIMTKIGIRMPRLPFGMIPGTKLEPLKISKTGQRAWSYAGSDPGHLLAFEIRW
ncbi:hypothetical protein Tco_0410256 [Tanacetum coccineum]